MKYSVWFFRFTVISVVIFALLGISKQLKFKKDQSTSPSPQPVIQPAPLPDQDTPENVFAAFRRALPFNDIERIKQLTHPGTLASVGNGEGPRWKDWIDTLKVQMADAEIKKVTYQKEGDIEFAEAIIFLNPPNRIDPPREGRLRFLKTNGSWYWAER